MRLWIRRLVQRTTKTIALNTPKNGDTNDHVPAFRLRTLRDFKLYIVPAFFFLIILIVVSCADEDTVESIDFKVISYGGNFRGSYWVDGGGAVTFTGTDSGNETYLYENRVDIENQLEVEADAIYSEDDENDLTSLEIKIYYDGTLVKSVQDTDDVNKVSLTYTTGEWSDSDEE